MKLFPNQRFWQFSNRDLHSLRAVAYSLALALSRNLPFFEIVKWIETNKKCYPNPDMREAMMYLLWEISGAFADPKIPEERYIEVGRGIFPYPMRMYFWPPKKSKGANK